MEESSSHRHVPGAKAFRGVRAGPGAVVEKIERDRQPEQRGDAEEPADEKRDHRVAVTRPPLGHGGKQGERGRHIKELYAMPPLPGGASNPRRKPGDLKRHMHDQHDQQRYAAERVHEPPM